MANILQRIKNYVFPTPDNPLSGNARDWNSIKNAQKNLSNYISPVQFQRIRQDAQLWRDAILEAEQAWYPHRVKMNRVYQDTILNAQVQACMNRRINLTLLKGFKLCDENGEDSEYTKLIDKKWFYDFILYTLQAQFFGYSLVSLGDLINDEFPDISIIRRHDISPDRLNVTSYVYSLSGAQFLEDPYKDWHIWIPTTTDIGVSSCGYGLLYKVALYEITCRNLLGFNTDYAELFGTPIRVGKTHKTAETGRGQYEQALRQMGSSGYIILDKLDDLDFVETKSNGKGYAVYDNLEQRCEKKISKVLLGHADALDSTPGKLGSMNGEESPVYQALEEIQTIDCRFVEYNVNKELLPRMRKLGIRIPENLHFEFKNDAEEEEFRKREDASNQVTANIFKTIHDSGGKADWKYFSDRTGINVEEAPEPDTFQPFGNKPNLSEKIKNRLNTLYK